MPNITPATAGMRLTAAWLNQFIPGSMAACALANSWTNHAGQSPLSARLVNAVTVHLVGSVNPGTTTGGTQIGTLPSSSYYPSTIQEIDAVIVAGTGAGSAVKLFVNSSGTITLSSAGCSGATQVIINGQYPLDI